ncbi:methyltransferase domain-containing protein [Nonlabens sp. Ci31]|uniref:SAM-dependent methyltransferase n=1 Tax=Nonlabens sp. Ci31 TaxID=2608253 RepID=UPI001462CD77|nr:methyltransferase domain-containing protein [Nonlabens sp. Ci31]QJP35352.1 methyltransferase domain-containing protein [Nonlabens sp. Ci31]
MALHYGYWDEHTLNHRQVLWNTNYQIAKHAQIKKSDYILDVGCGVGGTSIFLANQIGYKAHGITLSPTQVEQIKDYKKELDKNNRTEFSLPNFCKTNFSDHTFDVAFAMESAMHAEVKEELLEKVFRFLKPGGRLHIADYFLRHSKNIKEVYYLKNGQSLGL